MATDNNRVIDQLNSFLRGEISAVETYRLALETVTSLNARTDLADCVRSHQGRVSKLQSLIAQKGGEAATDSGAWGAFAKLVEGTAASMGERAAIAILEEGEDHGLNDYRADMTENLDTETLRIFQSEIYAAQERTHAVLSALKKQLAYEAQSAHP